jgi:hypothetical protein
MYLRLWLACIFTHQQQLTSWNIDLNHVVFFDPTSISHEPISEDTYYYRFTLDISIPHRHLKTLDLVVTSHHHHLGGQS